MRNIGGLCGRQGREPLQLAALISHASITSTNTWLHDCDGLSCCWLRRHFRTKIDRVSITGQQNSLTAYARDASRRLIAKAWIAHRRSASGHVRMQARMPKEWPEGTTYLRAPSYSKKLTKDKLDTLLLSKADLSSKELVLTTRGPYTNVKIAPIVITSHPAYGQYGLYATQHLPPDSFILPYLGFVHDQSDLDETSDYDLSLDRELGIGIDAWKMGNEARFINDYRGISPGPNAEFRDVLVDVGFGILEKRMGVFVLSAGKSGKRAKGIGRGEEILISYGKGFWAGRQSAAE